MAHVGTYFGRIKKAAIFAELMAQGAGHRAQGAKQSTVYQFFKFQ
jgi:hypothetical protein